MNFVIRKQGSMQPGKVNVTLQRGEVTVVVRDVPAKACECGEYYLSEEISARILGIAEEAVRQGAEIEVLRFAP